MTTKDTMQKLVVTNSFQGYFTNIHSQPSQCSIVCRLAVLLSKLSKKKNEIQIFNWYILIQYETYTEMQGFSWSPHPAKILPIPPHIRHLSPFLDQGLSPPAEVRPRKFEKFKYIFVSNLTTFKLKSTLKSCISCLK